MRGGQGRFSAWVLGGAALSSGLAMWLAVSGPALGRVAFLDNGARDNAGLDPVSGPWNLTDAVWADARGGGHLAFAPGDVAVLAPPSGDAPVVLTLDGDIAVAGMQVQGGTYRLAGGGLVAPAGGVAELRFAPPSPPPPAEVVPIETPSTDLPLLMAVPTILRGPRLMEGLTEPEGGATPPGTGDRVGGPPLARLFIDSALSGSFAVSGPGMVTYAGQSDAAVDLRIAADSIFTHAGQTTGRLRNAGTLSVQGRHQGDADNSGTLNIAGTVTGTVSNDGHLAMGGQIGGGLANRGTAHIAGRVGGVLDNAARAVLSLAGDLALDRLENAGTVSIRPEARLTARTGIANSGTLTVAGVLAGDVDQAATGTLRLTGRLTGALGNAGRAELAGRITGDLTNLENASTSLTGDLVAAGIRNAGRVTVGAGQVLTATGVENTGQIDNGGRLAGDVVNRGRLVSSGVLAGALDNRGQAWIAGRAGRVTNAAGAGIGITGNTRMETLANAGELTVASGARLAVDGGIGNRGRLTSDGVLVADVVNDGQLTARGGLSGRLSNRGTATLAGSTGAISNERGADLTVSDALTATRLDNAGQLTVARDRRLAVTGPATNTGRMALAGTLEADLRNAAGGNLGLDGGQMTGTLDNAGVVGVQGQAAVTGDVINRGSLIQTARDSVLRVGGLFRNAGRVSDGGLGRFRIIADRIVLEAGSRITGAVEMSGRARNLGKMRIDKPSVISDGLSNAKGADLSIRDRLDMQGSDLDNGGTVIVTATGVLAGAGQVTNRGLMRVDAGGSASADRFGNTDGGRLVNGGTLTGQVVNSGQMTNRAGATVQGDLFNGGTLVSDGQVTGLLENTGSAALSGQVGRLVGKAGGTIQTRGELTAGSVVNEGDLLVRRRDRLTATGGVDNRGTLTVNGGLTGNVDNSGRLEASGVITGDVDNSGTLISRRRIAGDLDNRGAAVLTGRADDVTNRKGGSLTVTGDLRLRSLTGRTGGTITVTGDGALAVDSPVQNDGTLVNDGDLRGDVRNTGTLTGTGRFQGDVLNSGTARLDGTVTGDLFNAGDLALRGGTVQGVLGNRGTARLSGRVGSLRNDTSGKVTIEGDLWTGGLLNRGTVWVLADSVLTARDGVDNRGELAVAGGRIDGQVRNGRDGVIRAGGRTRIGRLPVPDAPAPGLPGRDALSATGPAVTGPAATARPGLYNDGLVTLSNGRATDRLVVNGGLTGNGSYRLDLDLAQRRADQIIVRGGAVKGHLSFGFDVLTLDPGYRIGTRVKVLDIDAAYRKQSDFTYRFDPVGAANERIVYSLDQDAASGDLVIVSQTNPAIGALFGNIALTQSLIGSVINRPSSPYVVGLAANPGERHCGPGAWGRAVGGRADATGSTGNGINRFDSQISATYTGMQVGADLACADRPLQGWNIALGAIAGVNSGRTSQPVYAIDPSNSSRLTSVLASTTRADFTQSYAGVYVSATRGQWAADLQYRYENTDFDLRNSPVIGAGLGLNDSRFSSRARTFSGSVSYAFSLPQQGWQVVPTAGFAVTRSQSGLVRFDDGYQLDFRDNITRVGFAGASLSHSRVRPSGDSALTTYATVTVYRDFTKSMQSVFSWQGHPEFEPQLLSSDHLDTYGELSLGANYLKVLDAGSARAPRQFSASGRIDLRHGDQLNSIGISGQVRWQF